MRSCGDPDCDGAALAHEFNRCPHPKAVDFSLSGGIGRGDALEDGPRLPILIWCPDCGAIREGVNAWWKFPSLSAPSRFHG